MEKEILHSKDEKKKKYNLRLVLYEGRLLSEKYV